LFIVVIKPSFPVGWAVVRAVRYRRKLIRGKACFIGATGLLRVGHIAPTLDSPRPAGHPKAMEQTPEKPVSKQKVYTLVVEVGRKAGDGLPDKATGAALVIYASGVDEAEAVRETVAVLKVADLAPLDVSGYGTLEERLAEGDEVPEEERELMQRALDENSVVVAQMTPFYD
jgi:hypothetical protein